MSGTRQHIAQLNVARARHDFDDPRMAGFLALVEHVNAAADRAAGFVWRLKDESGGLNAGNEPREIVNLSVWQSIEDLQRFTWSGIHERSIARKAAWFEPCPEPYLVLWHVPCGSLPTLAEGFAKLELLRRVGPSAAAFGWESASSAARRLG
jgi:hypothetical protein